jgi:PAS domain S-box-containing protein
MKKKVYKLKDIEQILTFIPPIFIFILAIVIGVISFFVLEHKQKSQIELITQKTKLEQSFRYQNILNDYIQKADKQISLGLEETQKVLKKEVHTLGGIIQGLSLEKSVHIGDLYTYMRRVENATGISFVIFDAKHKALYGRQTAQDIQALIFSEKNNPNLLKITLMYIASQGNDSSLTWKNEIEKTIQVSYFEKSETQDWYIGAFSSIDSLKHLTANIFLNTIRDTEFQDYYLWLYDLESKKIFNFEGMKKWQISPKPSAKFIQYHYSKYFLTLGLTPTYDLTQKILSENIQNIQDEHKNKITILFFVVLFTTFVLIASTTLFATFIKKIFSAHNKRLENKNKLLNIWKERFELAVIASNDGLWDTNFQTNKTFFSKKWLDMLGYNIGDITSYEQWFSLIHKDDRALVNEALSEHINNQEVEHLICEYRLKTKQNKYKWVLARGKVFLNNDGSPKRLLMMSMDIDERKRVAKDLKDTELLVSDGNIIVLRVKNSENLEMLFVSESIKLYGYKKDDFYKKDLSYLDIIHPEDRDKVIATLLAHIKQGFQSFSLSYRIITKSSDIRWVFNRMLFIKDDFGNISNLYGYIYDISVLKQSELELSQLVAQEVQKNQAKERLLIQQNKLAAMGEMIGSIAHQWRQPLNNISLILHFIKDNFTHLDKKILQKHVENAKEQLEYMSHTIDDFRNFYKPSKEKNIFDVKNALFASISILKTQINNNHISLDIDGESFNINAHENEFKQAILNILSNAIDAIQANKPKKPNISIVLQDKTLSIANNGGSASEEVLQRMFEPYFTTKFETKGTGIGLYMTKTILENMGANITVHNIPEGIQFTITLNTDTKIN